jgi:cytochrome c-type biogenesis protein CcmE
MVQANWEKPASSTPARRSFFNDRTKYLVGSVLLIGAILYLVLSNTLGGARFFINVSDLTAEPARYANQQVRITGAVLGDTIVYDPENLLITFTVANIPDQYSDLAEALHDAVNDPAAPRMQVRVENQVKPELLQHEAQAIMTGHYGDDGIFHVSELQLKCPTRFTETGPSGEIIMPDGQGGSIHPPIDTIPAGSGV